MKIIHYIEIDGFQVVQGYSDAVRDPEATKAAAREYLEDNADCAALLESVASIRQELLEFESGAVEMMVSGKIHKGQLKKVLSDEVERRRPELRGLYRAIDELRNKAYTDRAVYFIPKPGEMLVDPSVCDALRARAVKPGNVLTTAGEELADHRGRRCFTRTDNGWTVRTIDKLGDELADGEIYEAELTDENRVELAEQAERERLDRLGPAGRRAEYEAHNKHKLTEAAIKMNELILSDVGDAAERSKQWLRDETDKLKKKYRIDL